MSHEGTDYCDFECPRCGLISHIHTEQLPDQIDLTEVTIITECPYGGIELALPIEGD